MSDTTTRDQIALTQTKEYKMDFSKNKMTRITVKSTDGKIGYLHISDPADSANETFEFLKMMGNTPIKINDDLKSDEFIGQLDSIISVDACEYSITINKA